MDQEFLPHFGAWDSAVLACDWCYSTENCQWLVSCEIRVSAASAGMKRMWDGTSNHCFSQGRICFGSQPTAINGSINLRWKRSRKQRPSWEPKMELQVLSAYQRKKTLHGKILSCESEFSHDKPKSARSAKDTWGLWCALHRNAEQSPLFFTYFPVVLLYPSRSAKCTSVPELTGSLIFLLHVGAGAILRITTRWQNDCTDSTYF